jgi:hypothetical protein
MTGGGDTGVKVVRVESGPGTGDKVYVVENADGSRWRVPEPLGTTRVEVLEGDIKFGPRRVRVL